jgi:hypothetical protein
MIEILAISIDFGLLILIWMVQLIVYPSFLYYEPNNLIIWHRKYTGLISILVAPMMFCQLGFTVFEAYSSFSAIAIAKLLLITFTWAFTFAYFAPVHTRVSQGKVSKPILEQLVKLNWYRTFAWTAILVLSMVNYYFL